MFLSSVTDIQTSIPEVYIIDNDLNTINFPATGAESVLDFLTTLSATDDSVQEYIIFAGGEFVIKEGGEDILEDGDVLRVTAENGIDWANYTLIEGIGE